MKFIVIFLSVVSFSYSQKIKVELDSLTTLDDESFHVEILSDKPKEKIVFPADIKPDKFLSLFYSFSSKNDELISIAIVQTDSSDKMYIDLNNDEDLTNDGSPINFKLSQNSIWFDITNQSDKNQKTRLILFRKPNIPDSSNKIFVDEEGNLLTEFAAMFASVNSDLNFTGERRTYFFDDRVALWRGKLNINDTLLHIGLFDYNNNGIFNDEDDLLLIDLNDDERLTYLQNEEIFALKDIFRIHGINYKLSHIDKYGSEILLEETKEEPTKYFSRLKGDINYDKQKYELEQEFWQLKFVDLNGDSITFDNFKGDFLLLNFWGEWCLPCREEIPVLTKAYKKFSSKLNLISFLNTTNLEEAIDLINLNNMEWSHILLSQEIEEKFRIKGYPTNLLIFPDGKRYIKVGMIYEDFFKNYVQ